MTAQIVEFARNRLLIDPWELRVLSAEHVVNIAPLARAAHAGLIEKEIVFLSPDEAIQSASGIPSYSKAVHCDTLPPLTVAKPLFGYRRKADGQFVLIDGMQRATVAQAMGFAQLTAWVISEENLVRFGILNSGRAVGQTLADLALEPGKVLAATLKTPIRDLHSPGDEFSNRSIVARPNVFMNLHEADGRDGYNHNSTLLSNTYILNAIEFIVAEETFRRREHQNKNQQRPLWRRLPVPKLDRGKFLKEIQYREMSVPSPYGYRTLCDRANRVVQACTDYKKRKQFELALAAEFDQVPLSELRKHIDYLMQLHGQLGRALERSLNHSMGQHILHDIETSDRQPLERITHAAVGSPGHQETTDLSLAEKFQVAVEAGVNPADFYINDAHCRGLFEWAIMLHFCSQERAFRPDLILAEVYLYRRAISLSKEYDDMSAYWNNLFRSFADIAVVDADSSTSAAPAENSHETSALDHFDRLCMDILIKADANGSLWTWPPLSRMTL